MSKVTWFTVAAAALASVAFAQAPIAAQATSGAMQRAVSPNTVHGEGKAPDAAPGEAVAKADPNDAIEIGTIKSVVIVGSVDFAEREGVGKAFEEALVDGTRKTIGDLKAAMTSVSKELMRRGYYLVSIQPASAEAYDEAKGSLSLIVDSGRFGDVKVSHSGEDSWHWYSQAQLEKRMKNVKSGDEFNYFRLREAISGMNSHPDLLADTKLTVRSAAAGEKADSRISRFADVALEVDESCPFHLVWDINNYGMEEIDDWQSSLTFQYLNLTRADDVLTISPAMSFNSDLKSISASYMRPFDWWKGMSGTIYGGYSDLDSDKVLPSLALEGTGYFAGLNWSMNLFDSEWRNFAFNAGVMYRFLEDEWSVAAYKLQKREVGILPLSVGLSYGDKKADWLGGRDFFSVAYSVNLASTEDDLEDYSEKAEDHYSVVRGGWQRLQPLFSESLPDDQKWRAWSIFTRLEGQYTPDVLISSERLAYGGYNCLRGYRTRGYMGDSGVYGTVELRTPVLCNPIAGLFCDMNGKSPFDRFQFLAFMDAGWLRYNKSYTNMEDDEFLYSAGFGIRAGLTKYASVNCDVAFPLRDAYAHEGDDDIEIYLSVKFQW